MATRKKSEIVEDVDNSAQLYTLEGVDEEIRSKLTVWGNSTQITINQLGPIAPGWAAMLQDIFMVVGAAIQEHS